MEVSDQSEMTLQGGYVIIYVIAHSYKVIVEKLILSMLLTWFSTISITGFLGSVVVAIASASSIGESLAEFT